MRSKSKPGTDGAPGGAPDKRLIDFLSDQCAPGGRGWERSELMAEDLLKALHSEDGKAWVLLGTVLDELQYSEVIRRSSDVQEFVGVLSWMCTNAITGGIEEVAAWFNTAAARRAASGLTRPTGNDNRQRVLEAWKSDVDAGRPLYGRQVRISRVVKLKPTTIRFIVDRLRASGQI